MPSKSLPFIFSLHTPNPVPPPPGPLRVEPPAPSTPPPRGRVLPRNRDAGRLRPPRHVHPHGLLPQPVRALCFFWGGSLCVWRGGCWAMDGRETGGASRCHSPVRLTCSQSQQSSRPLIRPPNIINHCRTQGDRFDPTPAAHCHFAHELFTLLASVRGVWVDPWIWSGCWFVCCYDTRTAGRH